MLSSHHQGLWGYIQNYGVAGSVWSHASVCIHKSEGVRKGEICCDKVYRQHQLGSISNRTETYNEMRLTELVLCMSSHSLWYQRQNWSYIKKAKLILYQHSFSEKLDTHHALSSANYLSIRSFSQTVLLSSSTVNCISKHLVAKHRDRWLRLTSTSFPLSLSLFLSFSCSSSLQWVS